MHDKVGFIPWFTYREGFRPIEGFSSDTGWGCMIRVAQMMLSNTLMRHINQKMATESPDEVQLTAGDLMKTVLPLFLDDYSKHEAPFSIRNILRVGKELLGKGAGEWYGAHSISQVIRVVNERYNTQYYKSFKILTFNEGIVYKDQINKVFSDSKTSTSVLAIIPLRLGLKKIDKTHY